MLTRIVVWIVKACTRFAATTVLLALIFAVAAGFYTARHFEINTDINTLISPDLDWRKRDIQFDKAFDQDSTIIAVVEGPTPELTASAATALYQKLVGDKEHFQAVLPLGSGEFFEKNGFLFLPKEEVAGLTKQFESAAPLTCCSRSRAKMNCALRWRRRGASACRRSVWAPAPTCW